MTVLVFFAFLAGIVTILSPCILPVLPIVLSGSIGGKSKPIGIVCGFIFSFSLFTLALSALVQVFNIPPNILRITAVIIIVGFGLTLAVPAIQGQFEIIMSRIMKKKSSSGRQGFSGGILTGMSLGLLWTPCVGPIMASVITLAVSSQVNGGAVAIIVAYSLGTAIPMFAIMVGGRRLLNRFPRLASSTGVIQRVFGIILIIAGLSIGLGVDRKFQTLVLETFPRYGTGLTAFERLDIVQDALEQWRGTGAESDELSWDDPPRNARLGDFGMAPPLIADGPWLNTEQAFDMESLEGKVVLVDFWTYSCINCVRTIPYLREWYDKYSDKGLEIIGVHSPEFPFERNTNNVRKAIDDLNVTWPVVMDNNFSQWNAYNNRYWPAHYFIDATGRIRYFYFGEGAYEESEKVIRKLLEEAGNETDVPLGLHKEIEFSDVTHETYLGYRRAAGFLSEAISDEAALYRFNGSPGSGEWSLEGEWVIRNDFIELNGSGGLEFGFKAKDVFLVIEPLSKESVLTIEIDGQRGGDTSDVTSGILKPDESRLYHLAELSEIEEHILSLRIEGHVRLFAFTFG